jgi:hypothetical protein
VSECCSAAEICVETLLARDPVGLSLQNCASMMPRS